jgi:hypothetical protein
MNRQDYSNYGLLVINLKTAKAERRDCIRISPVAPSVRWVTPADFFVVPCWPA